MLPAQTTRALQLAGVIGLEGNRAVWTGGNTTLVQMGDILDRGDEEIGERQPPSVHLSRALSLTVCHGIATAGILFLLQRLAEGAEAAGGAVYVLNGNHEILNVALDFSYVTAGAFQESARFGRRLEELFGDTAASGGSAVDPDNEKDAWQAALRARVGLFAPGGPLAQQFARNSTVLVVNDTVFAHGGLLPVHVRFGLERINEGVSRWMLGDEGDDLREALEHAKGPQSSVVWNRQFAREKGWRNPGVRYAQCGLLRQALSMVPGAKRLVVGHTPQRGGCNCECDGLVWRVDVGLSRGVFGNPPQALEIVGDTVRVLTSAGPRLEKRAPEKLAPPQWLVPKTKLRAPQGAGDDQ